MENVAAILTYGIPVVTEESFRLIKKRGQDSWGNGGGGGSLPFLII